MESHRRLFARRECLHRLQRQRRVVAFRMNIRREDPVRPVTGVERGSAATLARGHEPQPCADVSPLGFSFCPSAVLMISVHAETMPSPLGHAESRICPGHGWDHGGMGGQTGEQLRAAVVRLAWAADAQIEYLHGIGVGGLADELALEFDDAFAVHRACPGSLGPAGPVLADLDRALDRMSGEANARLWTGQALQSATEWREVRALARIIPSRASFAEP